jgi:tetratricopeptide (TPR) repeat protein
MSLESSYEHAGQEPPRSATSAETDRNPVIQGDSEGERLPADVTPASVPPDLDDLVDLLLAWIRTPDWSTSETYLQTHSELLTEAAAQVLATLTQRQPDQRVHEFLTLHQQLLQIAGQQGVEAAYQALLYQEEKNVSAATEQEELQAQVIAWLQTPDWETSQTYLQSHPQLLTDTAEQMMEALKRSQREQQAQAMINLHQALLQKARVEGVEAAYERFLVSEPETPLSGQEVMVNQDLQDPVALHDAGMVALRQYWTSGQVADLNRAVECWYEALNLTSSDSPDWPALLNNLGRGLRDRYFCIGELADLEAAISAFQQAVQATPPNSPDRAGHLNSLGIGLRTRYAHTRDLADLEAAISALQQAVQATLPDSPERPTLLNNLGNGLRDRYARTGELADLEAAISAYQQAVQATPSNSPERLRHLSNLGHGLRDRYARTGDLADLEAAIAAWEKGWSIPHPRFVTLPVTYQLGQQRQGAGITASLVTAYLERAKQRLPRSSSVPHRALEIAEGSKSRLLTQLVGRGPLPLPSGLSQEIAARELKFLADLTTLDTQELASHDYLVPTRSETSHLLRLQQRQTALRELEDLWTGIARTGPEGAAYVTLRRGAAPTWQEFVSLTKALGPATALLSFFTTADRALLFLLRAGWRSPRVVEVPLNQTGWADLLERFFREVHRYSPGLRRSETWDQPLRSLFTQAQHHLEGVERLILAPESSGHLLPWGVLIERAGCHTSAGQPLPLVTLPALGILPSLRQRPHVHTGPALVVGNPRGDLPYAEVEAKEVAERFGTKPLLGATATKSDVLAHFPDATLIHLATHAFFDADNPLESGIVLADGVLTAREVLQHHLQADLLVLSACESGQVGSLGGEELAGLSQAFLQTGVRSLLVSLWQVNDPATAALIQAFYLARQAGADKALALRRAMTKIQQDPRWTHPYYWGAFVLLGDWD